MSGAGHRPAPAAQPTSARSKLKPPRFRSKTRGLIPCPFLSAILLCKKRSRFPRVFWCFPHPTERGCWILCWNPRLRCFYTTPPPRIPPEQLASGSRRVSRQSGSPVDPAEYLARAACQWIPPSIPPERIPPSIPPERLASGSCRVSRQSGSPVDPSEYPAEYPLPVDPAEHPAEHPLPVDPAEYPASIPPVWFCSMSKTTDGNLGSKSPGCGGICCNGRKSVSVEGGDCSKRSVFLRKIRIPGENGR